MTAIFIKKRVKISISENMANVPIPISRGERPWAEEHYVGGQELTGDFRTLSISRSGFQSRQPLRQGVGYGNPTCKAVVICTYYEVTDSPIARLRIDPGLVDGK